MGNSAQEATPENTGDQPTLYWHDYETSPLIH